MSGFYKQKEVFMFKKVFSIRKTAKKKLLAAFSAFALIAGSVSVSNLLIDSSNDTKDITVAPQAAVSASSNYVEYEGITDGTILHAFCWSFDTIKANMKNIHDAGYTAIQTSPINTCNNSHPNLKLMGNDSANGTDGAWWWHYQPTDWKIGNYQLGTRDQFKAMCSEADNYGIKIIVDVVPNHTTPNLSKVASDLYNSAGGNLYHSTGFTPISSYSDRIQCTRYQMGGLADVDTENYGFQNYFISFLNDCIACGADGFRYDTAKHIALPSDPAPYGVNNNFWTRVTTEITNASSIFNYGEVLQGDNDRADAYVETIGSTCTSNYGRKIRNCITSMNVNVNSIMGYEISTSKTKNLVTWVESHDNYINDGTWSQLDDTHIKLAWAVITARENGIPLFFDRPNGGGPSNKWGTNQIGVAGSDLYRDDEIAAVNKFRTAMKGESEYLRNPNGDSNVLMIERGTKGIVIVNTKYNDYNINSTTNLSNGTYTNQTDNNNTFTVSNGTITGTIPARSIAVLYNTGHTPITTNSVTIYYKTSWFNTNIHYKIGNGSWTAVPGVAMASSSYSGYKTITINVGNASTLTACFNDGNGNWDNNNSSDYSFNVNSSNVFTVENGVINNCAPSGGSDNSITLYYKTSWSNTNIHYKTGNGSWTAVPGVAMASSSYSGYKVITIKQASCLTFCFNDGNGNWDNNYSNDYTINSSGTYTLSNGVIKSGTPN